MLSVRAALVSSVLLYGAMILNLAFLNGWRVSFDLVANGAAIFAAFGFVGGFSLVMEQYRMQKERAEQLLLDVEQSRQQLEAAHAQLRSYAGQVEELTVARERTRVAREIHDTLGHYLTILNVQLETISKLLERDPSRLAEEVAEARHVAAQSMQEVRNAVATLRPAGIATLSLAQALSQLGDDFKRAAPETELTLDLEADLPPLSPDVHLTLYRAAQEALTNARKHAQASNVLVRLRYEEDWLELLVLDNGRGVSEARPASAGQKASGFGLIGLGERVELLGGRVTYGPASPTGYRVTVRVQPSSAQRANLPARPEAMQGARP
jgi:signal transduction histidine kinase